MHGDAADIMLSHFNLAGMKSGAQRQSNLLSRRSEC